MPSWFLIHHIGHGGGGWLLSIFRNHPQHKIWCLGEVNKPSQLDFEGRGIEDTPENTTRAILDYFADAPHAHVQACGIIKCFTMPIRRWVEGHGGRQIQMVRNPISKCAGRVTLLNRPVRARKAYLKEYGREPETREEMVEAHFIFIRRKMFDRFLKPTRAKKMPIVRLEDLNESVGTDGKFFARVMEWLTYPCEWPAGYLQAIKRHHPPNQCYLHWTRWSRGKEVAINRRRIEELNSIVEKRRTFPNRTSCFRVDPESMITWSHWSDFLKATYTKWFGDVERRLGYNHVYPSSVSQDWEWEGKYEWGGVHD